MVPIKINPPPVGPFGSTGGGFLNVSASLVGRNTYPQDNTATNTLILPRLINGIEKQLIRIALILGIANCRQNLLVKLDILYRVKQ